MLDVRLRNRDNGSIVAIRVDEEGAYHMTAKTKIEPGQCILTDPGLAIFPSGLGSGPESSALIKERIDALPEREREVFFTLPQNRLYDYDEYYGRYVAHASVLRHSPKYACIFPLLSLASNGCRPNSVTSVLPTNKTTGNSRRRKGWKLALRASQLIKKGEEISFFKLVGGGRFRSRLENHVERFGYPCACNDCILPDDLHLPSEDQSWQLNQAWETAFGRDDVSSLALIHSISHMAQCCYYESITDKSMLLLYRRLFDRLVQEDDIMRAHVFAAKILKINARLIGWECDDFHQGHLMALHDRLDEEFRHDPGIMLKLEPLDYGQRMAWLFRLEETLREAEIPETCQDPHRDEEVFPSYTQLPEDDEGKVSDHFNLYHRPKKHWIFIASLVGLDLVTDRLLVRDRKQKAIPVCLDNVDLCAEVARILGPSSLILIPYAARITLENGKEAVSSPNQMIKDCQVDGWKNKGHKNDCKILGIKVIYDLFCRHPEAMINPIGWERRVVFFNAIDWAKLTPKATVSVADLIKKVQPVGVAPASKTKPVNLRVNTILEELGDIGPEE
ncbi:unnamed protein product [Clonostachys byssicola]|uniref:Uncharacterized protein n=1 Tax=Clonostachys byssicola TaxID=160290 RepID=A0A9N9U554_9HYPO|nr:unnamed protein product [Clonostachys byssicola]